MRALITGAAGFVGKVLSAHLRSQQWEILSSDVRAPDAVDWYACDVSDPNSVGKLVKWAGDVTCVFHLAAQTFVPESTRDPARTFEINLLGTVYLVAAVLAHAPDARLIYIGSAEAYGHPQSLPITEDHPLNPANPYAVSKALADGLCADMHRTDKLDAVRMRPFNHSGPGQSDAFVLSSFARQIARIEAGAAPPVIRVGNLQSARDFSHVNDVVRAYELAALKGIAGEAYNVCSGRAVVIRDALNALLSLSPAEIRIETDPERMRPVDVPEVYGSHEKLTARTGWLPEIPFNALLADLLTYWRDQETR